MRHALVLNRHVEVQSLASQIAVASLSNALVLVSVALGWLWPSWCLKHFEFLEGPLLFDLVDPLLNSIAACENVELLLLYLYWLLCLDVLSSACSVDLINCWEKQWFGSVLLSRKSSLQMLNS